MKIYNHPEILLVAKELIKRPTISGNLNSNRECLQWITSFLDNKQLEKKIIIHNNIPSLLVTSKHTKKIDVLLHGHIDVVPANSSQFEPKLTGDRLYGRGSLDMKGAVAVMLCLAKEYLANTHHGLLLTTDEEVGGKNGCGFLASFQKIKCNYFITGEPSNLTIASEEKGAIWLTIKITGKASHASTPWQGKNPILHLGKLVDEITKSYPCPQKESWVTTVSPTIIAGGQAQNQIPNEILLKLDCRYIPQDNPKQIIRKIASLCGKNNIEIQLLEPPLKSRSHPYTNVLEKIIKKRSNKMHFATDARFFSQAKISSIIFGPTGGSMHGADEWVSISSLMTYYSFLDRFLKEI